MISQKQFHNLVALVQDHLALLKEEGVRALPFERPWTPVPDTRPAAGAPPRAPRRPAQVSEPAPPRTAPPNPRPGRSNAVPARLPEGIRLARARRLASCNDGGDPAQHELLLCSVVETFEQPAVRKLLDDILRATGYEIFALEDQCDAAAVIAVRPPRAILAMGDLAVNALSSKRVQLRLIRGKWDRLGGIDMMPTFAPGYLLDHDSAKAAVWSDMKNLIKRLGLSLPPRPKKKK